MKKRSGFTLLELIISMVIIALIGSMLVGSFSGIMNSAAALERRSENYNSARFIIKKFTKDIQSATMLDNSLKGVFIGKNKDLLDSISFTSLSGGNFYSDNLRDLVLVKWEIKTNPENNTLYLLYRSENPYLMELDDETKDYSKGWTITDRLKSFDIRYLIKNEYKDEIETTRPDGVIPTAVELNFELEDPDGKLSKYSTFVIVGRKAIL